MRYTDEKRKAIADNVASLWQNPEYRKKMIEKQKAIGLRSYR
jgi:hypothetical protein